MSFFEDVHELPARIERYLMQMLLAGKLDAAAGFLIGNAPYDASDEERARYLPVEQVYRDLLEPLRKPAGLRPAARSRPQPRNHPHGDPRADDVEKKSVRVLEPAVK